MKFTIETTKLLEGLRTASVAMVGKQTLPILSNVKIEAKEDSIILSTTNLDIYVQKKIAAKVTKTGAVTAPFDLFSRLVGRIESAQISIEQKNNAIQFKAGDVTATIETLAAEEFPEPLRNKPDSGKECGAEDILLPFRMLEHGICEDQSRYVLTGINLSPDEGKTLFAATSGYRIVSYRGIDLGTENVIVPDVFVRALLKIAPTGQCKVSIGNGVVSLESQEMEIQAKLIEGKFPNWQNAVPERTDKAFSCGRKPLIQALQTCALFAPQQVPGLCLTGKGKEIEVSLPEKATAMVLGTELAGQPKITIRINSKFLIETLNVLDCENVRIQCHSSDSPILIEDGPFAAVINRLLAK